MKRKLFGNGPPVTESGQTQSFSRRAFFLGQLERVPARDNALDEQMRRRK